MLALSYVVRFRAQIVVGLGQGGLIASLMTRPLLLEASCRQRVATAREMTDIRRTWSGVVSLISIISAVMPSRTDYAELLAAAPEICSSRAGYS